MVNFYYYWKILLLEDPQASVGFQTRILSSFTYPHAHPNSFMKNADIYKNIYRTPPFNTFSYNKIKCT